MAKALNSSSVTCQSILWFGPSKKPSSVVMLNMIRRRMRILLRESDTHCRAYVLVCQEDCRNGVHFNLGARFGIIGVFHPMEESHAPSQETDPCRTESRPHATRRSLDRANADVDRNDNETKFDPN